MVNSYIVETDFYVGHIGEYTIFGTEGRRFEGVGNIPLVGLSIGTFNEATSSQAQGIKLHEFYNDNDTHENHIAFKSPNEDLLGKLVYVYKDETVIYVTRLSKFLSPCIYTGATKLFFPFENSKRMKLKFEIK